MLGAIAGDVIGSIYEHRPIKTIKFPLFHPLCRFTDDTVLTVALADSILHGTRDELGADLPAQLPPDFLLARTEPAHDRLLPLFVVLSRDSSADGTPFCRPGPISGSRHHPSGNEG